MGLIELRASFEQPANAPNVDVLVETYYKGKRVGLYNIRPAITWSWPKAVPSFISVGWQQEKKELSIVYDNGLKYGPFADYIRLSPKEFDGPTDAYYFTESKPEIRPSKYDGKSVKLFPVMGICGDRRAQLADLPNKTVSDLVKVYTSAGAETAVIIYLYFSEHGGGPPLEHKKAFKR